MKSKRVLSLLLALLMTLSTLLSATVILPSAEEPTGNAPAATAHPYVKDGLVSLYSGTQNGRAGHNTDATVWEDLVGQNDLPINKNDKNYFTASGLAAEGTKHNFPQGIVDVVNGQAFTVELLFSEFESLGSDFNTFLNSSNDNFALFRRIGTDQLEFKFCANPGDQRHKIDDGLNLLQNALITVTYEVGGTCYIYVNGELMAEKPSPSAMGANDLYIGHDSPQKTFHTTYRSMRFYDRALSAAEVRENYAAGIDIRQLYVADGLVSLYSGLDTGSTPGVWEDLVGENDVPVTIDEGNYFVENGYFHTRTQNYFPQGIVDVVNGQEFTVELHISGLVPRTESYCTLLNSTNDHFALFRRCSSDVLEFKFAANAAASRNTIPDCVEMLQDALITVTYRVGGESRIYINGQLQSAMSAPSAMGADDFFFGHAEEHRFFDAVYHSMRFYNRELTADEVKKNATADGYDVPTTDLPVVQNPGYVTVAQPQTHIVGDISMVRRINTTDEFQKLIAAEQKPAVAIYSLNSELCAISDKGARIASIDEILEGTEFKVLSAFYVKDTATADALAAYLKEIAFYDCFIMSSDPAVVKSFRKTLPTVSGVIDFTGTYKDASALTEAQCLDIRRTVKENYGTIAVLPAAVCSNETVQYLFERQVNVWVSAADNPSVKAQYDALLSGAIGVISDATDSLLDIACNELAASTMTRVATNVGHRGIPSKAPENTLEGSILAYELGANVIELDVYLTTDGHVVVMHDGSTGRTCNRDISVENSTLAQLKELYVNKDYENSADYSQCRIPTLEEYLEYFKGKDCNLFIEIKSNKRAIVGAIKELVDKHDMYGQCTIITFNAPILQYMREDYPEMHGGYLCGDIMTGATAEAGLRGAMSTIGKYNATINPSMGGYDATDIRVALQRGISIFPWTFRGDFNVYKSYFLWGYCGLTGDNANELGKYVASVAYSGQNTYSVGEAIPLELAITDYARNTANKSATVTILSGEQHVKVGDSSIEFTSPGEVTLVFAYQQRITRNENYTLYTQPITVTVTGEATETTPVDTDPAESVTEPVDTDPIDSTTEDVSDSITTDAGTEKADEKGCVSTVSAATLLLMTGAAALVFTKRKERD